MPTWRYPEINGDRLREARVSKGMTLQEVGEQCGQIMPPPIHSRNLSQYELGAVRPSPYRLRVICQVLGIEPDEVTAAA
jgi:transcriptional regulator with XRE-family HTH domain